MYATRTRIQGSREGDRYVYVYKDMFIPFKYFLVYVVTERELGNIELVKHFDAVGINIWPSELLFLFLLKIH